MFVRQSGLLDRWSLFRAAHQRAKVSKQLVYFTGVNAQFSHFIFYKFIA